MQSKGEYFDDYSVCNKIRSWANTYAQDCNRDTTAFLLLQMLRSKYML